MLPPVSIAELEEQVFESIEEDDQPEPSDLSEFYADQRMPELVEGLDIQNEEAQAQGLEASGSYSEPQVSTNQTSRSEPPLHEGLPNLQVRAPNHQPPASKV